MRKLKLKAQTLRVLASKELEIAHGGVIVGPTNGDVECPTTAGFPGCEPQSQACTNGCFSVARSCMHVCDPWPPPPP